MQVSVLMETIEALQSGPSEGQEQHVVSLTAQLMMGRTKENLLETRFAALTASNGVLMKQTSEARASAEAAEQARAETAAQAATARAQVDMLTGEVTALKDELRHQEAEVLRLVQQLDVAAEQQAEAESKESGLQTALERARTRHFEQLNTERLTSSSAARDAQSQALTRAIAHAQTGVESPEPVYLARMRGRMAQVLDAVAGADQQDAQGTGIIHISSTLNRPFWDTSNLYLVFNCQYLPKTFGAT